MAKRKQKDTPMEMDTDPIGVPKRKRKSKKGDAQLANLILEGRSEDVRIVTVHTDPPKKKRRWLRWGIIGFAVLWVMSLFAPPREDTQPPQANQVASVPSNTPRPSLTPVIRETVTAEALASMVALQVQNGPTQTPIVEYVVITATPSETDIPTETSIPTDVPLPSATPVPSATPTQTLIIRDVTEEGLITGMRVNVRSCTNVQCEILGQAFGGELYRISAIIDNGQNVQGNTVWYRIDYKGVTGYVSDELMDIVYPVSLPVVVPTVHIQPTAPISVAPQWSCSGDLYNCSDFGRGGRFTCQQLQEYMRVCPSDPSRLDQGGVAGKACESRCP